jgi:hypothetical protein
MADFEMQLDETGDVIAAACPMGHSAVISRSAQGKSFRLGFDLSTCQGCAFYPQEQCPIRTNKKKRVCWLTVPKERAASSQRRRRFEQTKEQARRLRPAVEATIFQLKHKFRWGKVLVRGLLRVTHVLLCAALALNLRRIDRYSKGKQRGKLTRNQSESLQPGFCFLFIEALWQYMACSVRPFRPIFGC